MWRTRGARTRFVSPWRRSLRRPPARRHTSAARLAPCSLHRSSRCTRSCSLHRPAIFLVRIQSARRTAGPRSICSDPDPDLEPAERRGLGIRNREHGTAHLTSAASCISRSDVASRTSSARLARARCWRSRPVAAALAAMPMPIGRGHHELALAPRAMAAIGTATASALPHVDRALGSVLATPLLEMHEVVLSTPPCHFPGSDPERATHRRSEIDWF